MKAKDWLKVFGKTALILALIVVVIFVGTVAAIRFVLPHFSSKILGPSEARYDSSAWSNIRENFHFPPPAKEYFVKGYRWNMHERTYLYLFEFLVEGEITNQQKYVAEVLDASYTFWSWANVSPVDDTLGDAGKIAKNFGLSHVMDSNSTLCYYGFTDGVLRVGLQYTIW